MGSGLAIARRVRPRALEDVADGAALALALAWSALLLALVGGAFTLPLHPDWLLLVPLLLAFARLLRRGRASGALTLAAGLTVILAAALWLTPFVLRLPIVVFAVPVTAAAGWLTSRFPVPAVIATFLATGAFGSVAAFWSVSLPPVVDVLLAGLWLGGVWGWFLGARDRPLVVWPAVWLLLAYALVTVGQALLADSVDLALRSFRISGWYMSAFLVVALSPAVRGHGRAIARGFVLVALLVGAYATFRWVFGQSGTETAYSLARSPNEVLNGKMRLIGSFTTGKQLAAWTAWMIPFCLAMALTYRDRWRWVALAAVGALAVAMLGADVRIAVVAIAPAVLVVLALYQLSRAFPGLHLGGTLASVFVIAVVGVGAFAFTLAGESDTANRYRVLLTNPTSDPSYQARVFKWETALRDVSEHPFGQGLGSSGEVQKRFGRFANVSTIDVDNSYLKIALEQGFAVMLLYVAGLVALFAGLVSRAVTVRDRARAGLAMGAAGSLLSFAIFLTASTYIEGLPALSVWLVVGLAVGQFLWAGPLSAPRGGS